MSEMSSTAHDGECREVEGAGRSKDAKTGGIKGMHFSTWREWIAAGVGGLCSLFNALNIAELASGRDIIPGGGPETPATRGVGYASSTMGIAIAPYAVYNETQLAQEGSLRSAMNEIREEINRFARENKKLTIEINRLERFVERLQEIEGALSELTRQQDSDLETFMNAVREQKRILDEMKKLIRAKALEDVISLVLRCDSNGDFHLTGNEIEEFLLGMELLEDIQFDEEVLRRQIKKRGSVHCVLNLVKDLVLDDSAEDSVVDVNESKVGSVLHRSSADVAIRPSSFLESTRVGAITSIHSRN